MDKLKYLLNSLEKNDKLMRVVHTFWQAFLAVFLLGITGVLNGYLKTHNVSDAEAALLALTVAAAAAGLAAIKGLVVAYLEA